MEYIYQENRILKTDDEHERKTYPKRGGIFFNIIFILLQSIFTQNKFAFEKDGVVSFVRKKKTKRRGGKKRTWDIAFSNNGRKEKNKIGKTGTFKFQLFYRFCISSGVVLLHKIQRCKKRQ